MPADPASAVPLVYPTERHAHGTMWHNFTQQRLKAWQPNLSPAGVLRVYFACGCIFLVSGALLLHVNSGVDEYVQDYTDLSRRQDGERIGHVDFHIERDMQPPVWVYYALQGFHQNHRRYVESLVPAQLFQADAPEIRSERLHDCLPWVTEGGRVNYPCGLVARSVFNDSFVLQLKTPSDDSFEALPMDSSAEAIAWDADRDGRYMNIDPEAAPHGRPNQELLNMWILERFPPVKCEQTVISEDMPYIPPRVRKRGGEASGGPEALACQDYMSSPSCEFERNGTAIECEGPDYRLERVQGWGVESGHFMVWMRVAGLPSFRKLFGRIDEIVPAGSTVRVHFTDDFPVKPFRGRKSIVLSTSTVLGGRSPILGYGYLLVGGLCLLLGAVSLVRHFGA